MKDFVKRMIDEHKELVARIDKLKDFVYNDGTPSKVPIIEYANLCIQLKAMRVYADTLETRLANQGICLDNGVYFEAVDSMTKEPGIKDQSHE